MSISTAWSKAIKMLIDAQVEGAEPEEVAEMMRQLFVILKEVADEQQASAQDVSNAEDPTDVAASYARGFARISECLSKARAVAESLK